MFFAGIELEQLTRTKEISGVHGIASEPWEEPISGHLPILVR
jgi:hypothetical protein